MRLMSLRTSVMNFVAFCFMTPQIKKQITKEYLTILESLTEVDNVQISIGYQQDLYNL